MAEFALFTRLNGIEEWVHVYTFINKDRAEEAAELLNSRPSLEAKIVEVSAA